MFDRPAHAIEDSSLFVSREVRARIFRFDKACYSAHTIFTPISYFSLAILGLRELPAVQRLTDFIHRVRIRNVPSERRDIFLINSVVIN